MRAESLSCTPYLLMVVTGPGCVQRKRHACNVAAIGRLVGVEYAATACLAHLACGHCGDAVMRMIVQAGQLHGDSLFEESVIGLRPA